MGHIKSNPTGPFKGVLAGVDIVHWLVKPIVDYTFTTWQITGNQFHVNTTTTSGVRTLFIADYS